MRIIPNIMEILYNTIQYNTVQHMLMAVFRTIRGVLSKWTGIGYEAHSRKDDGEGSGDGDVDPVDALVEIYVRKEAINVPLLPDFVERHIYGTVLRLVIYQLQSKAGEVEVDFFGRRLGLDFAPLSAREIKRTCEAANRRMTSDRKRAHHSAVESCTSRLLESGRIDIGMLPEGIERVLYSNVVGLVLGILHDTFASTTVSFLAHDLDFNFRPTKRHEKTKGKEDEDEKGNTERKECAAQTTTDRLADINTATNTDTTDGRADINAATNTDTTDGRADIDAATNTDTTDGRADIEKSRARVIGDMVENNVFLIPDSTERRLYVTALQAAIGVMDEAIASTRVCLLHHRIETRFRDEHVA